MNYDNKIRYICKKDYRYFFYYDNVAAVGLGYKIKNGFYTCKKCLKIFVRKKLKEYNLRSHSLIPKEYKGIKTDVAEIGSLKMQTLNKRVRPVPCGYNIGTITLNTNGTLGCLVSDGKEYYLLSNNHVLAFYNTVDIATPIVQPSKPIGGAKSKNIIASLSKYVPLKESTIYKEELNCVDCAIARVPNKTFIDPKIPFLGELKGVTTPKLGEKVKKVGCTTELTTGTIIDLGITAKVLGEDNKLYIYKDQIFTNNMSSEGDSGAILINKDKKAIGLLMGGSESVSIYNCIHCVLNSLNVQIVI